MGIRTLRAYATLLAALSLAIPAAAQTITGSIVGSVIDPSGAAVAGAKVTATLTSTGVEREIQTDERGAFVFTALQPGDYDLAVTASGFKKLERRGLALSSQETLPAGQLTLDIGALADTVTVTAQGATVQTASAERSGTILGSQLENLMIKGRNAMSLLQLMPGVVDLQLTEKIDRNFEFYVQGNRRNSSAVTVEGMPVNAIGNNFNTIVMLSQDAIAEMRVLLTNYQAEYGRSSGATVNIIGKSGTRQFHGLGSYFKRHEQFNANNFFNNRLGVVKPRYRYNTWNYNVGGPIYIPGKFNKSKDKLFFFWSQEYWPLKVPTAISQLTVPTELERTGDFSQSLDLNGRLITVTDPSSKLPFPGNRIPADRVDSSGLALLKVFPAANFFNRGISGGRYNYVFQSENELPLHMENLRVDYNLNPRNTLNFTMAWFVDQQTGGFGTLTNTSNVWPQITKTYRLHGQAYVLRYTRIISPTLINETSLGVTRRPENNSASAEEIKKNQRSTVGFVAGQLNPATNPLDFIPNATFGGVTGAASLNMEGRFPFWQKINSFSLTNNLTKIWGPHTIKVGVVLDRHFQGAFNDGTYTGNFSFARDTNNPLDTGYAYANAALGVYASYTEQTSRVYIHYRQFTDEFFAQDTWKLTRRLTLDYGMRFHHLDPIFMSDDAMSVYVPSLYDPKQAVRLIAPRLVGGRRVGVDPITGTTYLATQIGALVPGVGNPANGTALAGRGGLPRGLVNGYGILLGPRFGFALDVFGNGKTAVRGGFGMFYNRPNMSENYLRFVGQLPLVQNPTLYYGTLAGLRSATGVVFPQNVNGFDRSSTSPSVMNYSLSVQQNVGFGTVVDVGYVGSLGRHLMWLRDLNYVPFGARFDPKNADPSNPAVPLSDAFLRPTPGYNALNVSEAAGSSNYHSMQVTARRRFTRNVQFGAAWTWSKAMDYSDYDTSGISMIVPIRVWNYGLASWDRTHNFKLDWLWNLPKVPWRQPVVKMALNDWQLSGITSFMSGAPVNVGFSTTTGIDLTGTPSQGARIYQTGNAVLPKGERTFSRNFRTDVFGLPAKGTVGNAATYQLRGPGTNNWDVAIFKDFPIREAMRLQYRLELYNAFNHTQFSSFDSTARFDAQGNQVNALLGQFTVARSPRIMQMALRFYF